LSCQPTQSGQGIYHSTPGRHRNNRMQLKNFFRFPQKTCLTTLFWLKSRVFVRKLTLWQFKKFFRDSSRLNCLQKKI
jgi:hypothetical protein